MLLDQDAELRQLSLSKLQQQGNNHGSTPLIVAAAAAGEQPEVFARLLAVADADVLEARTKQGAAGLGDSTTAGVVVALVSSIAELG